MNRITVLLIAVLFTLLNSVRAQDIDLLIKNGHLIDPKNNIDGTMDVAIKDNKILEVAKNIPSNRAQTVVDAKGLYVTPGFIDLHSHAQFPKSREFQAHDGVTTALELEVGVYPVAEWYESQGTSALINFGASVSHLAARAKVKDGIDIGHLTSLKGFKIARQSTRWERESANNSEIEQLIINLNQGLEEGALGVGLPLQYTSGATREEIFRVFKFAAKKNTTIFVHLRFSGNNEIDGGVAALQEIIANVATTGASTHVAHITSTGLNQTPQMIEMIDDANARGFDLSLETYPYTAASTMIASTFFDPGWQQRYGISYGDLLYIKTNKRLTEENFQMYREQGGLVITHMIPPDIALYAVQQPSVLIASDAIGFIKGRGHPRAAGTFARVLGHYAREQKALTLMQALRKMTIMPAKRLAEYVPQMRNKGRLQVGADADITIFNLETIIDKATYENPMQHSKGIEYVIVNGELVIKDGKLIQGNKPGRPIRNN